MTSTGLTLALVMVLILINAVFAGSEIALISLREGQLRQLEQRDGPRARALVRLARDPNRFLATIQIGITLAGFLASATAAVNLAEPLVPALGMFGHAAQPVAIAGVTLAMTFLTLVLGELAPKRLAMQFALPWSLLVARALEALALISRPVVWLLSVTSDAVVRLLGGSPETGEADLAPEELRAIVVGHRGLDVEQRTIMAGALEIHERILRKVLVPRRSVFTLPADMPREEALMALARSGHSRAPVVSSGDLDDAGGVVHLRDLVLNPQADVAQLATPPLVFPDTVRVTAALRRFKAERQQLALVVDEHGAADGIVTLEDLLEEVVGEIYDESDRDVLSVITEPDGSMLLPGTFPMHDLVDLNAELKDAPQGDYTTIAGLVLVALGRIPQRPGDRIELAEWTVEVIAVEHHAITRVRLTRRPPAVEHPFDAPSALSTPEPRGRRPAG